LNKGVHRAALSPSLSWPSRPGRVWKRTTIHPTALLHLLVCVTQHSNLAPLHDDYLPYDEPPRGAEPRPSDPPSMPGQPGPQYSTRMPGPTHIDLESQLSMESQRIPSQHPRPDDGASPGDARYWPGPLTPPREPSESEDSDDSNTARAIPISALAPLRDAFILAIIRMDANANMAHRGDLNTSPDLD
jgi:hypothetical protein